MPRHCPGPRGPRAACDWPRYSRYPPCRLSLCAESRRLLFGFHQLDAPLAHAVRKRVEQLHAVFPANAPIGDALPVDERLARHQVLTAGLQMALDPAAANTAVAACQLPRDVAADD